jgi:hypothetical protein
VLVIGAAERNELVKLRQEALHAMADKMVKEDAPNGAFIGSGNSPSVAQ